MKCAVCMGHIRSAQACPQCVAKWCGECHARIATHFAQTMCATVDHMVGGRLMQETAFSPLCPVCRTPVTSHHSLDDPMLIGALLAIRRFPEELSDAMLADTRKYMQAASAIQTLTEQIEHIQDRLESSDNPLDIAWNQCQLESFERLRHKETCNIRAEVPQLVERTTSLATDLMLNESMASEEVRRILHRWDRATSPIQFSTFLQERVGFLQMNIELAEMLHSMISHMQRRVEVRCYIDIIRGAQRLRNGLARLCRRHKSCTNSPETPNDMCDLLRVVSTTTDPLKMI